MFQVEAVIVISSRRFSQLRHNKDSEEKDGSILCSFGDLQSDFIRLLRELS